VWPYHPGRGQAHRGGDRRRHRDRQGRRGGAAALARQGDQVVILGRRAEVGPAIDVLVNNAGGTGSVDEGAPLEEAERIWDEVVGSNLKSAFLLAWAALPHLRRPGGRVVNISSVAAYSGRGGIYTVAKAGVVGLTYWLALDLGAEGRQRRVDQIPAGRPGRPEEIAAAVAYLASPQAAYVNGEVHHVNGGWQFGR
jgi:3-oxoacyl-[acyl-carrier protein] reductase